VASDLGIVSSLALGADGRIRRLERAGDDTRRLWASLPEAARGVGEERAVLARLLDTIEGEIVEDMLSKRLLDTPFRDYP